MSRRGIVLFLTLGVLWGIPYLLIKVAIGHLSPGMLVLGRTGVAALLLIPVAARRGEIAPLLPRWRPLAVYTVVELVVPWYLLSTAEQRLPSSLTALLIAAVPLSGVAVAFLLGRADPLSRTNTFGILLGMAGVAALVGLDVHGADLGAVGEVAVVTVGYALGPAILARWLSDEPPLGVVTVSMAGTALIYVPIVLIAGSWPHSAPPAGTIAAVVTLAVLCSAGAFLAMIALIAEIGPVRSTAITYINPGVAIIAGAIFLNEQITVWTLAGFVLVLAGSWLVTRPSARRDPGDGSRPHKAPAVATTALPPEAAPELAADAAP